MEADSEAARATSGASPLALSIGAAGASVVCIAVIGIRGILSYEKGADWSVSVLSLIAQTGVWLLVFVGIAWMATAAIRALPGNSSAVVATLASIMAALSLIFAIAGAGWTIAGATNLAKHPNRQIYSLYSAACKADKDAVKRALANGVSPTKRWTDISPGDGGDAVAAYFKCYKNGQTFDQDLVEILLAAGSSLTSRPEGYGTPPLEVVLIYAPQEDRVRAAKYLVGKGLSPNGGSNSPGRPLAIAAGRGDLETARALLSLGASIDVPNLAGSLFTGDKRFCSDSAQSWPDAARFDVRKHLAVADLLVEHGLKITQKALQAGRAFCRGADNVMVTQLDARININPGK